MFEVPILFIVFNRPGTERKVLEVLKKIKPKYLYVAADGPRKNKPQDKEKCAEAKKIIEEIDWDCQIMKLYQTENFGCGLAPAKAISWFFKNVEEGIVLEDDCIPDISFFKYSQELLEKYRDNEKIMMISGDNFQNRVVTDDSYYFSRHCHCWGWASWRRAWQKFDYKIATWPEIKKKGEIRTLFDDNKLLQFYWSKIFDLSAAGKLDVWDYQWTYTCLINHGLTVLPKVNLVTNVGFGGASTHTFFKSNALDLKTNELPFPLKHPNNITRNVAADVFTDHLIFLKPRVFLGLILRLIEK